MGDGVDTPQTVTTTRAPCGAKNYNYDVKQDVAVTKSTDMGRKCCGVDNKNISKTSEPDHL